MKNIKLYVLITIFFSFLAIAIFGFMERFIEPRVSNAFAKTRVDLFDKKAKENVVIVMIDPKSIDKIRWPWKRKLYAEIIEYLNDYGQASVIAHDSLIYAPDDDFPESDKYFFDTIKKYDNYIGAFDAGRNLSLKSVMYGKELELFKSKSTLDIAYEKNFSYAPINGIIKLNPNQVKSAATFGSVVTPIDVDGYIRSAYPVVKIGKSSYPMLAFAAVMKHKKINKLVVKDNYLCSIDDCKTLKIRVNNTPYGLKMFINWYKPLDDFTTHKTYSAIDIIDSYRLIKEGKEPIINPNEFNNKIVIIGGAAKVKGLEDIKNTPIISNMHAGADIQATVMSNILENDPHYEIKLGLKFLIAFGVTLLSIWIVSAFGLYASLISLSVLMIGYLSTAFILYVKGITIQAVTPIVLILLVVAAGFTFRFLIEGKKKEQIQNAMGMYISKDIMKSVVKNIDNIKLGGKRANISVLFADIRGFTSISEQLSAEEVTSILNEYFSAVEPVIRKHKGVLNKFIGDAVLAIFGEPIQDKNHAKNAVLCADEMHKKIVALQDKWLYEGKPNIEIGIAINTGEAFVGNIGSPERIEYTVIGDTVNTASRIESYNKVYKTRFLISESTYEKVNRMCDVIKIREVAIRGKSKKINIYEVLRVSEEQNAKE